MLVKTMNENKAMENRERRKFVKEFMKVSIFLMSHKL